MNEGRQGGRSWANHCRVTDQTAQMAETEQTGCAGGAGCTKCDLVDAVPGRRLPSNGVGDFMAHRGSVRHAGVNFGMAFFWIIGQAGFVVMLASGTIRVVSLGSVSGRCRSGRCRSG